MNTNISLPFPVKEALARLDAGGYESWLVGGVRDLILGREPRDWDITTSARPEEIKKIFADCHQNSTGEKFGTVSVHFNGLVLDITTFRKDGVYHDHRHPDKICFTKNLFEDLKRRDFTVNAIVYHPEKGFRDYFCGKRDLKKKWIRAIGDADERFSQDAIRILRALRFASVLGFSIEEKTCAALHRNKELLLTLPPERILPEFTRMLCGKYILQVLTDFADVIGVLVPEMLPAVGFSQHSPFHQYDVWQHTAHAVSYGAMVPEIRLALFFHDISKPGCLSIDNTGRGHFYGHPKKSAKMAKEIMERMHFPTKQISLISLLVAYHDSHPSKPQEVKKILSELGEENFFLLCRIMEADAMAHSRWSVKKRLEHVHKIRKTAQEILETGQCYSLKTLAIRGEDLAEIGFSGPKIGELLEVTLKKVIAEEWENDKNDLLEKLGNLQTKEKE